MSKFYKIRTESTAAGIQYLAYAFDQSTAVEKVFTVYRSTVINKRTVTRTNAEMQAELSALEDALRAAGYVLTDSYDAICVHPSQIINCRDNFTRI